MNNFGMYSSVATIVVLLLGPQVARAFAPSAASVTGAVSHWTFRTPSALCDTSQREVLDLDQVSGKREQSVIFPVSAEDFVKARDKHMADNKKVRGQLTAYPAEKLRLQGNTCYLTKDGLTGILLIHETGEGSNLFNYGNAGQGRQATVECINLGMTSLECFDGPLTRFYGQYGFFADKRVSFDDYLLDAPKEWDQASFDQKKYGRPDVVLMKLAEGRDALRIRKSADKGEHVITLRPFKRGTMITQVDGPEVPEMTQTSLSVKKDGRMTFVEDPIVGKLTHSCSPNVMMSPTGDLCALEDIWVNDVLSIE